MNEITSEAFFLIKNGPAEQAFEKREFRISSIQEDEIIIESEAFGLNFADVMARKGLYQDAPPLPCVVGYEVVGKVIEVGSDLNSVLLGKRVASFCRFGGYGRHVVTKANAAVTVNDEPAAELLAMCTQGVTAYYMAEYLINIHPGEKVLVHAAAGGVGSILIQLAKNKGAEVYAKVGSDEKIKSVIELGADIALNYRKEDYGNQLERILMDDRLDISFNPAGGATFKKDMKLLGAGGKIVLFGGSEISNGKFGVFSKINFLRKMGIVIPVFLMMQSKSILGVNMLRIADDKPDVLRVCLESVIALYKSGKIKPLVGGVYDSTDIGKAHSDLESGKTTGKLIITW